MQVLRDRKKGKLSETDSPEFHHGKGIEGLLMLEEVARDSAGAYATSTPYKEMLANARIASGFYAGDISYDVTKEIVSDILGRNS